MHKELTIVSALILSTATISLAQFDLSGTVTDARTGEPVVNAEVNLLGQDLFGRTDSAGHYSLSNLRVIRPFESGSTIGSPFASLLVRGNAIHIALPRPARVRIDLFGTDGRLRSRLVDAQFPEGGSAVGFDDRALHDGVFVVRAVVGSELAVLRCARDGQGRLVSAGRPGSRQHADSGTAKRTMTLDSLFVYKTGYRTGAAAVDTFIAVRDFQLDSACHFPDILPDSCWADFYGVEGVAPGVSTSADITCQLGSPALTNETATYSYYYYPEMGLKFAINAATGVVAGAYAYGKGWPFNVGGETGIFARYPCPTEQRILLDSTSVMDDVLEAYGTPVRMATLGNVDTTATYPRFFKYSRTVNSKTGSMEFYFWGTDTSDYAGRKIIEIVLY